METAICENQTAGVLVEFHDDAGNTVGQAVFSEWPGLQLPAVGDRLSCQARSTMSGHSEPLLGRVRSRHFEVQEDDAGRACLWVRLNVATTMPASRRCQATQERPCRFSDN